MANADPDSIGARIAAYRKLRHLTQRALAEKANISYSLMFQIEQGRREVTPSVCAALARALSVPVADLTGQPYVDALRQDQLDSLVQPLREAIDLYDLGTDPDLPTRTEAELITAASHMCGLIRAGDLRTATAELAGLIAETTSAAYTTPSERLWQALASNYRSAYDVATKLGFHDLSALALDRMAWAAERASDAVSASTRQYLRSLAYLRAGQYRTGMRIAEAGRKIAAQADAGVEQQAITGQLHLGSAVLAARAGDGDEADEHLAAADRIAEQAGEIHRVRWLTFGPTNVAVHRTSALVDQSRYREALLVASTITVPDDWPASRAAHHHAEIARAYLWSNRADAAFRSLIQARSLAPQQSRHSPAVRETMLGIVRAHRRAPDTVTGFATWLGL